MNSRESAICYHCGKETEMPFRCNYCNLTFCSEHRLPEAHNCINLPDREWHAYKKITQSRSTAKKKSISMKYVGLAGIVIIILLLLYYLFYLT
ncbi:MAG: AN1-type zinc finger domain-containing protein [Candidatus Bathyarchaeota archaeon]